ncbi:hypothetical protein PQU96_10775 [Vogesella sp. LYT5W]|uniref:Uncharacterized protein n=1 Tax=Vogesella margarita TaxID=2984199 RepID=A0ABT5IQ00_9NEIS|nr:hypothetical protein [Vogesella margarita]MDC7714602.1 hypothetical protein [Vogesella margarita]
MPLPTDPLELAILLHKKLQHIAMHGRQVAGKVPAELAFEEVESALDTAGLLVAPNTRQNSVEFSLPADFFRSLEELIEAPSRRILPPSRFYLADDDCLCEGDAPALAQSVQHYLAAAKLYSLLGQAADHQGGVGSAKSLIFLHKEKIELAPEYTISDLRELPGIVGFQSDFIESTTHKEQKKTIVKTVLLEMFAGRGRVPFAELLVQFRDFMEKVHASYQLYVSEFSFQKVKELIEKEKLDATIKLNKVFSDIQNQLLAVPAALILAGGQMENSHDWTGKNVLIWLGVLVFAILMTLLVRNQRHTLHAVKQEIDQQWEQIRGKYHSVAERFQESYKQLDLRYNHQEMLIKVVSMLVTLALAVTTYMLLHFSVPEPLMIESLQWGLGVSSSLLAWDILIWVIKRYFPEKFTR